MQYDLERWRGLFAQTTKDNTDFKCSLFLHYIKKKTKSENYEGDDRVKRKN